MGTNSKSWLTEIGKESAWEGVPSIRFVEKFGSENSELGGTSLEQD